jgi:hypothetical protein
VKSAEEIMNILEAYDLTGSFRDAGELAGCSHRTVARYVRAREEERLAPGASAPRPGVIEGFLPKLEELVERSKGRVRADVAHEKITAMGFTGSVPAVRRRLSPCHRQPGTQVSRLCPARNRTLPSRACLTIRGVPRDLAERSASSHFRRASRAPAVRPR